MIKSSVFLRFRYVLSVPAGCFYSYSWLLLVLAHAGPVVGRGGLGVGGGSPGALGGHVDALGEGGLEHGELRDYLSLSCALGHLVGGGGLAGQARQLDVLGTALHGALALGAGADRAGGQADVVGGLVNQVAHGGDGEAARLGGAVQQGASQVGHRGGDVVL